MDPLKLVQPQNHENDDGEAIPMDSLQLVKPQDQSVDTLSPPTPGHDTGSIGIEVLTYTI